MQATSSDSDLLRRPQGSVYRFALRMSAKTEIRGSNAGSIPGTDAGKEPVRPGAGRLCEFSFRRGPESCLPNIQRGQPDPALFTIPSNYRVEDEEAKMKTSKRAMEAETKKATKLLTAGMRKK